MKRIFATVIVICMMLCASIAYGTIIRVPDDQPTIQAGIDAAVDGDTVLVADGTYIGDGNRDLDFGGRAITVTSENGPENCIIDCEGTWVEPHRGFYFHSGETETSVVDGFTIKNGYVDFGGGISCFSSSPTITNCTITGNTADGDGSGGGISCSSSSATITNCTITGNTADWSGSGISCSSSSATITNCTITGNTGAFRGGGISCYYSSPTMSPTITNCTITGNTADWFGGIYCYSSSPTIQNCTISGNTAARGGGSGGGINCESSSATITNCTITGNTGDRGGIYCYSSSPTITNCTITGNTANWGGGGIYCDSSSPTLTNCTITGNTANWGGGGIYCHYYSSPTITNCILWNDNPQEIYFDSGYPNAITVSYSDVEGGEEGIVHNHPDDIIMWGDGNIDADPLFGNPYSGLEYDLAPGSPCLNAGTSEGAPSTDILGRPRPNPPGSNPDMGAYEQNEDASLAVELSSFTASVSTNGVTLHWRTESEMNNLGFNVYRSEQRNGEYVKVNSARIKGAGTDATPHNYQFVDETVEDGKTYYYYLQDVDFNGNTHKSDLIKVTVSHQTQPLKKSQPPFFALFQNYPNPFNPETWIPYQLAYDSTVTISIYNAKGQIIHTISLGTKQAGVYVKKDKAAYWDGKDSLGQSVASGVYYYTLQAGEFRATQKMFIMK